MRKALEREYYVCELDALDVPRGVIAGPFDSAKQAIAAGEAILPLISAEPRLCPVGGDLFLLGTAHY